jgi:hypothetical protein
MLPAECCREQVEMPRDDRRVAALEHEALRPLVAYSVEKLGARFFGDDFGGLKPSPD